MPRASVCFDYHGHCVEYGSDLNLPYDFLDACDAASLDNRIPFLCVDGVYIPLTPGLLRGWEIRAFGDAVCAYVQWHYPPKRGNGARGGTILKPSGSGKEHL